MTLHTLSGRRTQIVLLHGALGNATTLRPVSDRLPGHFAVHCPDLPGHGGRSRENQPLTCASLVSFLEDFLNENGITDPVVFGYSLGGYIALAHAIQYPGRIARILTLATKFEWTPETASREIQKLQADVIETQVPAFAAALRERHGADQWKEVLSRTAQLMQGLGTHPEVTPETAAQVQIPVLIAVGSEDRMVSHEESQRLAQSIPGGRFKLIDGAPHAIERISPEVITALVTGESL